MGLVEAVKDALPRPVRKGLGKLVGPFMPRYRQPVPPLSAAGTALVVIGMLNEALEGVRSPHRFCQSMQELLALCRAAGMPVIHSKSRHSLEDRSDWTLCMLASSGDPGFIEGTHGNAWIEGFEPRDGEHVLLRNRYSVFHNTPLRSWLLDLGVEQLIIAGTHSEYCIHYSVMDAYASNFPTYVIADCSASTSARFHRSTFAFFDQHDFIYPVTMPYVRQHLGTPVATDR